jgi:hypothetical protein
MTCENYPALQKLKRRNDMLRMTARVSVTRKRGSLYFSFPQLGVSFC